MELQGQIHFYKLTDQVLLLVMKSNCWNRLLEGGIGLISSVRVILSDKVEEIEENMFDWVAK